MTMYRKFRGADPALEPLMYGRGLAERPPRIAENFPYDPQFEEDDDYIELLTRLHRGKRKLPTAWTGNSCRTNNEDKGQAQPFSWMIPLTIEEAEAFDYP